MPENNTVQKPNRPSNPVTVLIKNIYKFLASAKLAILLLVAILISCLLGVTALRARASELIFHATWFNTLMVLLVINVACCFFWKEHGGQYGTAGLPDIICCYRGRFVAFEVKTETGRPSKLQEITIQRIKAAKGVACIVRSVEEVKQILDTLEVRFIDNRLDVS
jgi:hypothetical protein